MGSNADFASGRVHRFPGLVAQLPFMGRDKSKSSHLLAPHPWIVGVLSLGHVGK